MSLTKSAARRVSLLAGSSLIAASLATAAFTGAVFAPSAVLAADECTPVAPTLGNGSGPVSDDPGLNGSAADSFACSTTPLANGITYSSNGDLTVTKTNTGVTIINAGGVDLIGNGADSVTWVSTAGAITGGQTVTSPGPVGALIDVATASGAINITTAGVNANRAGTTYGVHAVSGNPLTSTPGGAITINTSAGGTNNNVAGGQAAILANTNGGNISITTGPGFTQSRLRGIIAQTSGAGTINITTGGDVRVDAVEGQAGISTVAGTGATTIKINAGQVQGGVGVAIRSVSSGSVLVQSAGTISGGVDFSSVAGGASIAGGSWNATGASTFTAIADTVTLGGGSLATGGTISLGGGADTFSGSFTVSGLLDFGVGADVLNTGGFGFTIDGGTVDLGAGADTVNVPGTLSITNGALNFGADSDLLAMSDLFNIENAAIDFGAGSDEFHQDGVVFAGGLTTVSNLEVFENAGAIYLGGLRLAAGTDVGDRTDAVANDNLRISSGVFTGSGDSRFVFDANLGAHGAQIGCATITVADCVDFTGATTAGSTLVTVQDISFSIDGGTIGAAVTLIEGSTAADHFTLASDSSFYVETADGGVIRKPVVAYRFVYDETNHRHLLIGTPTDEPFQVGTFSAAAQEVWRLTTGSWLTRQADLRATPGGLQASRGVWGKVGAQVGEREATASYAQGGATFDYDLSQKQRIANLTFGADIFGYASGETALVMGAMVGFVRSDVEFDATPTEAVTSGFSGGVYASYLAGPLFIDATANANILHVKAEASAMGLGLDVPMRFDLKSLGGQVEAGWRIPMGSLFVEPLVGAAYVVTRIDDTEVPGGSGEFAFEESKNLRLGGGARVGLDSELAGMIASYSLTGRYWNDSEGQGSATITTASGSSALLEDDFGGGFGELVASVNLYSEGGGLSGFLNLGGKFADGYQAVDGSAGLRVRW